MISHKQVEKYLLSLPKSTLEYPFDEKTAVYKINFSKKEPKMFALIAEKSDPVRISLKCDPKLAIILRKKYETVMPGYHLNKKNWNTIVLTGQLPWEEIKGFIDHSYQLVSQD